MKLRQVLLGTAVRVRTKGPVTNFDGAAVVPTAVRAFATCPGRQMVMLSPVASAAGVVVPFLAPAPGDWTVWVQVLDPVAVVEQAEVKVRPVPVPPA